MFTEVYSSTCAVRNHASVRNEVKRESLTNERLGNVMYFLLVDA